MDLEPLPSILAAVEQGRGQRGSQSRRLPPSRLLRPDRAPVRAWSRVRAVLLTLLSEGWPYRAVAEELGISTARVGQLHSEACDAVLRSVPSSAEAETACAPVWRWWCDQRGLPEACARV